MKKSLSHAKWECKYHIVWIPKRRKKVIFGKLRKEVGEPAFAFHKKAISIAKEVQANINPYEDKLKFLMEKL